MASIFSKIIAGDIPCYKIAENEQFFAFMDINPMAKGHLLVIPKKEVDYIFDLEDDTLSAMILFSKTISTALKKAIPCNRIGMMVVGLEVPHAHIHLIPINQESDMSLANKGIKLEPHEFIEIAEAIRREL